MVKTKLSDVPVVNDKLYHETAITTREDTNDVENIVKFVGAYIKNTMQEGLMQGVMIPGFGKFKPKEKTLNGKAKAIRNRANGLDAYKAAIAGRKLSKKNTDETI